MLNLISTYIGRPISDLRLSLVMPDLEIIAAEVVDKLQAQDLEFQDRQGRWHSIRVRPYKTVDNKIDGVLIAWVDINEVKRGKAEIELAQTYAQAILEAVPEPLVVLDIHLDSRPRRFSFNARSIIAGEHTSMIVLAMREVTDRASG